MGANLVGAVAVAGVAGTFSFLEAAAADHASNVSRARSSEIGIRFINWFGVKRD
jgi:hypothetical protein